MVKVHALMVTHVAMVIQDLAVLLLMESVVDTALAVPLATAVVELCVLEKKPPRSKSSQNCLLSKIRSS